MRFFENNAMESQIEVLRSKARRLPGWLRSPLKRIANPLYRVQNRRYAQWVKAYDTLSSRDIHRIRRVVDELSYRPLISVIMPAYNSRPSAFRAAIESVCNQLYGHLELCVADDASISLKMSDILGEYSARDRRVRWIRRGINGNISAASNSALSLASGEFIALLDHDDLLSPRALYEVALCLNKHPNLDVIYTDEDQIDSRGRRHTPYFKTDLNKALLLGQNCISHLGVYRRSLVDELGGFRIGLEGSQDHDLALRCIDSTTPDRIHHLPDVLYHWRRGTGLASFSEDRSAQCSAASIKAITDHFARNNESAQATPHPALPTWTRIVRKVPSPAPMVSVIVLIRNRDDLLDACTRGLLDRTDYPNFELLLVEQKSRANAANGLSKRLALDPRVKILQCGSDDDCSAMTNLAVSEARGSILAMIGVEIEVISGDWLSEMVSWAVLKDAGAVGARLIGADGRVQHAGLALGLGGVANSFNRSLPRNSMGCFGRNLLSSDVSAVSGACLVVRKSVFEQAGGLDSHSLPFAFNDVDLCLRIKRMGYRNIWNASAELYQREAVGKCVDAQPGAVAGLQTETDHMLRTWGEIISEDPFYNANLSNDVDRCFELSFPPRRRRSWD
jgi:glycosyltransferase involved in cell wall biosynthesis